MKLSQFFGKKTPEVTMDNTGVKKTGVLPVGKEQLKEFTLILKDYNARLQPTKARIIASENWWKVRNTTEEQKQTNIGKDGGFTSKSSWLHNVIVSKHADAAEAYPQANILPREKDDRQEAQMLSSIVPCILEMNGFEKTYSDVQWDKARTGTGVYKVVWDASKLNGLGDIAIESPSLLNLYWEPGVDDIQKSRYFFQTELVDKELLKQRYPEYADSFKGNTFVSSKFLYDDTVNTADKLTVIEVYYHKQIGGKNTLQYCKYVNDVVLYATENQEQLAQKGLYAHGLYPYDFDPLFPIKGSPCGYGYVDICKCPQTEIDLMKTSFVKNVQVGATPRFFRRSDSGVNVEQFLDLSNPLVDVNGNMGADALRQIDFKPLDSIYVNVYDRTVQELRETSGNTETSTGSTSSGVTAASAIAALQEASGKGSRDSTKASYRSFERVVKMVLELIREFYTAPRSFRIVGQHGMEDFTSYTNAGMQPQHQGNDFGKNQGYRLPVFDIKVSAQKKNVYTTVAQNELALQFFKLGFFNPQATDQALMCLELMDFDGKDIVIQKVSQNGTMFQKLIQYMQMSLMLAQSAAPQLVQGLSQDIMMTMGQSGAMGQASGKILQADAVNGLNGKEHAMVSNARARANQASQPTQSAAVKEEKK